MGESYGYAIGDTLERIKEMPVTRDEEEEEEEEEDLTRRIENEEPWKVCNSRTTFLKTTSKKIKCHQPRERKHSPSDNDVSEVVYRSEDPETDPLNAVLPFRIHGGCYS